MNFATFVEEITDIHHIFPAKYCERAGIDRSLWNSVVNKTPIYARTNRIIGGVAPSKYISSIERNHGVTPSEIDERLTSHQIDVADIRADNFNDYYQHRAQSLLNLIEEATGKPVSGREDKIGALTEAEVVEMNVLESDEF